MRETDIGTNKWNALIYCNTITATFGGAQDSQFLTALRLRGPYRGGGI